MAAWLLRGMPSCACRAACHPRPMAWPAHGCREACVRPLRPMAWPAHSASQHAYGHRARAWLARGMGLGGMSSAILRAHAWPMRPMAWPAHGCREPCVRPLRPMAWPAHAASRHDIGHHTRAWLLRGMPAALRPMAWPVRAAWTPSAPHARAMAWPRHTSLGHLSCNPPTDSGNGEKVLASLALRTWARSLDLGYKHRKLPSIAKSLASLRGGG